MTSQENQLNQLLTHANLRIGTGKKIRFFISFGMNGAVCVFVCVTCECACVCMEVRECFNRTESWRSRVAELH